MTYSDIYNQRTPFIISRTIDGLVDGELYINPSNNLLYIYYKDKQHIPISYTRLEKTIATMLKANTGNLTNQEIAQAVSDSNYLWKWMEDNKNPNINTIEDDAIDIYKTFEGYDSNETVKQRIGSLVEKEEGKGLSTNNFTLQDLLKLLSIDEDANNYTHPLDLQCDLGEMVESVTINGVYKTGEVIISKEELGYGGVEYGANKYEHPRKQQCTAGVSSLNGKKGYIELTAKDFGINNLPNAGLAHKEDYDNKSKETFFASDTILSYLNEIKAVDSVKFNKELVPEYSIQITVDKPEMIREITVGGVTIPTEEDGIYDFKIYQNSCIISIIDRSRNNLKIERVTGLKKNRTQKYRYIHNGSLSKI